MKFTQTDKNATVEINDGQERFYTTYQIDSVADWDRVERAFIKGDGEESGTATFTILRSRSRKYPIGTIIHVEWNENEITETISRPR